MTDGGENMVHLADFRISAAEAASLGRVAVMARDIGNVSALAYELISLSLSHD
jgi:hypothetical protein